jgi:hypothetical protein
MTRKSLPHSKPRSARFLPEMMEIMARFRLMGGAAGVVLLFLPSLARADQFVLFDATFTYTWDDAMNATPSKSHYYVNG